MCQGKEREGGMKGFTRRIKGQSSQSITPSLPQWYWCDILDVDIFFHILGQTLHRLTFEKAYMHYIVAKREYLIILKNNKITLKLHNGLSSVYCVVKTREQANNRHMGYGLNWLMQPKVHQRNHLKFGPYTWPVYILDQSYLFEHMGNKLLHFPTWCKFWN
jgi:hypothetical protein